MIAIEIFTGQSDVLNPERLNNKAWIDSKLRINVIAHPIPELKQYGPARREEARPYVITPIVFVGLKLAPKRGMRPLGKLMWWAMGKSRPPHMVALKVEAKGQLNGRQAEVHARIAHPDGYELTAIPVVAYLQQYLDGTARTSSDWN